MRRFTAREKVMLDTIIWLFNKLNDYIAGSGANEEDTKELVSIKENVNFWRSRL